MSIGLFSKLARGNIRKNRKLFVPYMISGTVLVMMTYILMYLFSSATLDQIEGGGVMREMMLPIAIIVVVLFSFFFMLYCNSFLMKQRSRELGLYNVLGMDKKNISMLMLWESLMTSAASIIAGLILGIALSKLAELIMVNLLKEEATFAFNISWAAVLKTILCFVIIYALMLVISMLRVGTSSTIELIKGSSTGEKPVKANWLVAIIGAVFLGTAYFIALTIDDPLSAVVWFIVAVILVIIGTYLLFIAGSVAICKLLQKNKRFYYNPQHFVSVSTMAYRMKRNGAGLASICILITCVLVLITSTFSLYAGEANTLETNFPYDMRFIMGNRTLDEKQFTEICDQIREIVPDIIDENIYNSSYFEGIFVDGTYELSRKDYDGSIMDGLSNLANVEVVSLADYNRMMSAQEELADDECLIYTNGIDIDAETFDMENCKSLRIKKHVDKTKTTGVEADLSIVPYVVIVVNDPDQYLTPVQNQRDSYGLYGLNTIWSFSWDMSGTTEEKLEKYDKLSQVIYEIAQEYTDENSINVISLRSKDATRSSFYTLYGSLLFIGLMLSMIFIFVSIVIIYYKQLAEGYEDQKRFEVMQKVGMTKAEIRKSINAQVLIVFFAPMAGAVIHLAVASRIIWKLLQLFFFRNIWIMIAVAAGCVVIFLVIYAVVYKLTSNEYYSIVSKKA